jgi:hypothetical protein
VIFVVVLVTTLDNVDGYRAGDGADVGGWGGNMSHPHCDHTLFGGVSSFQPHWVSVVHRKFTLVMLSCSHTHHSYCECEWDEYGVEQFCVMFHLLSSLMNHRNSLIILTWKDSGRCHPCWYGFVKIKVFRKNLEINLTTGTKALKLIESEAKIA